MGRPRSLYFIDRGERPETHRAPYHRYIICTDAARAYWEAGPWSGSGAWMWTKGASADCQWHGWLLLRWFGLDIEYGGLVHGRTPSDRLPDGCYPGFSHPAPDGMPWPALPLAVWWSDKEIPAYLAELGVKLPEDRFSLDDIANPNQRLEYRKNTRVLFPSEEVAHLSDWLEDRGHVEAAEDMRRHLLRIGGSS